MKRAPHQSEQSALLFISQTVTLKGTGLLTALGHDVHGKDKGIFCVAQSCTPGPGGHRDLGVRGKHLLRGWMEGWREGGEKEGLGTLNETLPPPPSFSAERYQESSSC